MNTSIQLDREMISTSSTAINPNKINTLPPPETALKVGFHDFRQWLIGPGEKLIPRPYIREPDHFIGNIPDYSKWESPLLQMDSFDSLELDLSGDISQIFTTLVGNSSKVEISVPITGDRPHSHLVRIQKNEDGTFFITAEDREREGVRPDGDTLSIVTSGTLNAEDSRFYGMKGEYFFNELDASCTLRESGHNALSYSIWFLLQASASPEFVLKRYSQSSNKCELQKISGDSWPYDVRSSFIIALQLFEECSNSLNARANTIPDSGGI
jgi:hypothetical protein